MSYILIWEISNIIADRKYEKIKNYEPIISLIQNNLTEIIMKIEKK